MTYTDTAINRAARASFDGALSDMQARENYEDALAERAEQITWSDEGQADAIGDADDEQWARLCAAARSGDALRTGREFIALVQEYGQQHSYGKARDEIERRRNEWDGD